MAFTVLIPARMASARLPGKPLRDIGGRPMILHVVDRARASGADAVWVATEDESIRGACEDDGVAVVMTGRDHRSGSERLAEACERLGLADDVAVVNVQGDEPLIPPALIAQVAGLLDEDPDAPMASLYHGIEDPSDVTDPNVVKVVCDANDRALYFSRAPIPYVRDAGPAAAGTHLRHIGLYAYRAGFLRRFVSWPPSPAERHEALEQLRALHNGAAVRMARACAQPGPGVDTESDLERVRGLAGTVG